MKRILILAACAVMLLPLNAVIAAPVPSSPIGINATDDNPFEVFMDVLKDMKEIKENLLAVKADTEKPKKFINQAEMDAAAQLFVELLRLQELQDKYGEIPVSGDQLSRLTDFLLKNYELLSDKPLTNEAEEDLYTKIHATHTINDLIDFLVANF